MGKVVLIGAGPGDVDLLTLKGKEYIKQADCIVYDRLASKDILDFAKTDCEFVFVGKENHHHVMKQDDINEFLYERSKTANLVVRLKGGDPYVFGRGGEEALYLIERDTEVEVVPGVTSAVAALADAGIPITHRGLAKGFQVITAHSKKDEASDIDYGQLLDDSVTLVFLMGLAHVGEIAKGLMEAGRSATTPAAVISKATTPFQRKVVGDLSNIDQLVTESKLESPAIIVVGEVVTLNDQLNFFEKKPLLGKRCLVPYIESFKYSFFTGAEKIYENRLGNMLKAKGAMVDSLKIGAIVPVEADVLKAASEGGWLIFTSANGIYAFMWNLSRQGADLRALSNCKFAVVGQKTAAVLSNFGMKADLVPQKATADSVAEELSRIITSEDKVFYFSAEKVADSLENKLGSICKLERLVVYRNDKTEDVVENIKWDYAFFTSASTAVRTIDIVGKESFACAVSIGPKCTEALESRGVKNIEEAIEASYEFMIPKN